MAVLIQFAIGLIFGVGLVVAGMSDPAKVLNFLDFAAIPARTWDASLAFVLGGAVAVTAIGFRLVLRRGQPVFGTAFHLPNARAIDARIITGPAIFGIGWGLAGFCPGPALTALGAGTLPAITFVASMLVGMIAARWLAERQTTAASLTGA
ncbi:YeeE/YedE family protein [Fertoebacter nigrum]|uniref:YeeE/YedE family protein n=1 Tax=Fertoeibacter niger TaxID=2656921 RepID=A0A8X8H5A7_9RHOB|nr:DUF6691 family protein [Fertoeibacter niger]NUB46712.1 YeeE/YedE family protein [Fertoeibacter niger]